MSAPTVTVKVDGQERDIADCFWIAVAPCGCASAAMVTCQYGQGFEVIGYTMTEAAAWLEFEPKASIRQQEIDRGVTLKLIHRDEYMAVMKAECTHTPRWGRTPLPDGVAWGLATGGRVIHLVDEVDGPDTVNYEHRDPKCGAKRNLFEVHPSVRSDGPMCKKCLTWAEAAA